MKLQVLPNFLLLITACLLAACSSDPENPFCQDVYQPDLVVNGPLLVQGQALDSSRLTINFPNGCDGNPLRGTITINIDNPSQVPGANLFFKYNGQANPAWQNDIVPRNGTLDTYIYMAPDTVNGQLATPQSGDYEVVLTARMSTLNLQGEMDTERLKIQVMGDGLNLVIIEPSLENTYSPGTDSVRLQATISDNTSGIASVSYRLGDLPTNTLTYDQASEVNLDEMVYVPQAGRQTITVTATNSAGQSIERSSEFNIPENQNINLTSIRWDGEGDNLNWHDVRNWEGDRLPRINERAIVDLAGTDRVEISSITGQAAIYNVGAIDINANLIIHDNMKLQVNASEDSSFIRGSLEFFHFSIYNFPGASLNFGFQTENSKIIVEDTLYLASAYFGSASEGQFYDNEIISRGLAYDGPERGAIQPFAAIDHGLRLTLRGDTEQKRPFTWDLVGEPQNEAGTTEILNYGTWSMVDNSVIRRFDELGTYTRECRIINRGRIQVERSISNSIFSIDGAVFINNSAGQWIDSTANPGIAPGRTIYNQNRSTGSSLLILRNFYTDSEFVVEAGSFALDNVHTPKFTIDYNNGLGDLPYIELSGNHSSIDLIDIVEGELLAIGETYLPAISTQLEGVLTTDRLTVDSLVLGGKSFSIGDTLHTRYIDWQGAENLSGRDAVLHIMPHPQQLQSIFRPGTSINSSFQNEFTYNNQTIVEGNLAWYRGILTSSISGEHTSLLRISPGAELLIDNGFEVRWFGPGGTGQKRLDVEIEGTLRKAGFVNATIYGCPILQGEGQIQNSSNTLNFMQDGWVCE